MRDGASSIETIQCKLKSPAWAEQPRGPIANYFGILLAALDELDKPAFEAAVARLRRSKLHPVHARTLELLAQRLLDEPATYVAEAVPVFIASGLADRDRIVRCIEGWSETEGLALEDVTRIDVIPRDTELNYLGKYSLRYSGIILTWPVGPARGLALWWRHLNAEFTFYHEVGHHVSGHVEGGQVEEQEQEADAFARSMLRRSRPVLMSVARAMLWPLMPVIKRAALQSR